MYNTDRATSGIRRLIVAILAMLTSMAMLCVCVIPASAENAESDDGSSQSVTTQDGTISGGTGSSAGDSSASGASGEGGEGSSSNGTQSDPAENTMDEGSAVDVPQNKLSSAPACGAVTNWNVLKQCAESTTATVITITSPIVVSTPDAVATVKSNITLSSNLESQQERSLKTTRKSEGPLFVVAGGASLTVGKDSNDDGFSYTGTRSFASTQPAGTLLSGGVLTVNNGVFDDIDISWNGCAGGTCAKGALVYSQGTTIINGGTFSNNIARTGGVVYTHVGDVSITGGTFSGNTADNAGVMNMDASTSAEISGGVFTGNTASSERADASNGGGVVRNNRGTLTISGGTFGGVDETAANTAYNGGVIFQKGADTDIALGRGTTITGGEFIGNSATGSFKDYVHGSFNGTGGGAVYSSAGLLTIKGGTFSGNHTSTTMGFSGGGAVYAKGTLRLEGNPVFDGNWAHLGEYGSSPIVGGGAGGATQAGAGGAIFLQDYSVAYLFGGTFTDNESGYLGGAIYTEENSMSYIGHAAATQNTAGHFGGGLWLCPSGKANTSKEGSIALYENNVDVSLDSNNREGNNPKYAAGDDFAMMNPAHKGLSENHFELLDTWFTDRLNTVVDWYQDGQPAETATGYSTTGFKTTGKPRYLEHSASNTRQDAGLLTLKKADKYGIALKSIVKPGIDTSDTWNKAALKFSGNKAKWSGGAIGSNGMLSFSSAYTASWNKVDAADTTKTLTGSAWKLSTGKNAGGPSDPNIGVDAQCTPGVDNEACWKEDANGTKSLIIRDNGVRDNNPNDGRFGIDNLKPGAYSLVEIEAPAGFGISAQTYTFTIVDNQKEPPAIQVGSDIVPGRNITNKRISGLSWSKISGASNSTGKLPGSEWKIESIDSSGQVTGATSLDIKDCTSETLDGSGGCSADRKDTNPLPGEFTVAGLTAGRYKLTETEAPVGYWRPDPATTFYTFEVTGSANESVKLKDEGGQELSTNAVRNTPRAVQWLKVDSADRRKLSGSEWSVTRTKDDGGVSVSETGRTVVDCTSGSDSCAYATNSITSYADKSTTPGLIQISELALGTYELKETKAPYGYVLSNRIYTFTLSAAMDESEYATVPIKFNGQSLGSGNPVSNSKSAAIALPLTGGTDARGWLLFGGIGAAGAAIALALTNEYRKRKGLNV
jgi:hypothetical protein